MKKLIVIATALSTLMNIGFAQTFRIKGSDTCLPLIQKQSENYMKKNAGSSITVVGGGSGVGIAALISDNTDIAMASRKIKMDEKLKLKESGKDFKEVVFAKDAVSIVVNPANKISQLTKEQLAGIFSGKITNWKEVGGDDMAIVVYSRESSSGTYEFVKEHVMDSKNYAATALLMPATGAIIQSVSQTKGAIGYVGLAYIEKTIKALNVSYDGGKTYISPNMKSAKNGTYPITRPLQVYYLTKSEKTVSPYIQYLLSAEGQKTVEAEGYVPLK